MSEEAEKEEMKDRCNLSTAKLLQLKGVQVHHQAGDRWHQRRFFRRVAVLKGSGRPSVLWQGGAGSQGSPCAPEMGFGCVQTQLGGLGGC